MMCAAALAMPLASPTAGRFGSAAYAANRKQAAHVLNKLSAEYMVKEKEKKAKAVSGKRNQPEPSHGSSDPPTDSDEDEDDDE